VTAIRTDLPIAVPWHGFDVLRRMEQFPKLRNAIVQIVVFDDGVWRIVLRADSICVAMKSKHKQTALITGASSGIGLGLTKGFLAAGFNVVANSRHVVAKAIEYYIQRRRK